MRAALTIGVLCSLLGGAEASAAQPVRVNVTGTWSTNLPGGPDVRMFQEGDLVWGKSLPDPGSATLRGAWNEGRLILVYTEYLIDPGNASCGQRTMVVLTSKGTATRLEGQTGFGGDHVGPAYWSRSAADPGAPFQYPYGVELKRCGQLPTWELAFETNSDKLKGTDWPVLAAVADLLKKDSALKIQVAGHTDSTGDVTHNQDLSSRRAQAVKKALVEKYGASTGRITTKGWGPDQPLADNQTEEGRAINRRVEILVAH